MFWDLSRKASRSFRQDRPIEGSEKKQLCKEDYIRPAMRAIKSIIGDANVSRCWWLFELGKTEDEWLRWYITEHFKE